MIRGTGRADSFPSDLLINCYVVPTNWAPQFGLSQFHYSAGGLISLGGPRSLFLRLLSVFHRAQSVNIQLWFQSTEGRPAKQTAIFVSLPAQPTRRYQRFVFDAFDSCSVSIKIRAIRFTLHFLNLRLSQSAAQITSHWCSLAPDMRLKQYPSRNSLPTSVSVQASRNHLSFD
jgi:hypothetical protein